MSKQFDITWVDRGHPPRVAPNPHFPDGVEVDLRGSPSLRGCYTPLPYPTGHKNVGGWLVECRKCGVTSYITAASRLDDPKSAVIPCKIEVEE